MALIPAAEFGRISGVAPLSVFCDASGTTDSSTDKPFHKPVYVWEVIDVAWGNYSYGTGLSKSVKIGPEAMFVFPEAGTFTIRLSVLSGGEVARETQTITVTDPNTVFAGTDTIVVSTDGTFTGKPTSAQEVTSSDFDDVLNTHIATGKRILFRGGQTFTASARSDIDVAGPGSIGSFGTGKAIVQSGDHTILNGANNATDWRIQDLAIDGQSNTSSIGFAGGGSFIQFTLRNLDFSNVKFATQMDVNTLDLLNDVGTTTVSGTEASGQDVITVASAANMVVGQAISVALSGGLDDHVSVIEGISGTDITIEDALPADSVNNGTVQFWALPHNPSHPLWDQLCIAECTVDTVIGDGSSGANAMFFAGSRVGLLGNLADPQLGGEHGFRAMRLDRAAIYSNTAQNINSIKVCFSMRSLNFAGTPTLAAGSYSEKMVFRGNRAIGGGSAGGCGPNNDTTTGRWRNVIIEGNWYKAEADSTDRVTIASATLVTVRNNVFDLSDQTAAGGARSVLVRNDITHGLTPNNIDIENNSFYRSDADTGAVEYRPIVVQTGITDSVLVRDNLAYGPLTTSPVMVTLQGTASVTDDNNSTAAQIVNTLPFTDATPTDPTAGEFAPADYALGSASSEGPQNDFNGDIRVSRDMGAVGGTVQSIEDWLESLEDSSPGLVEALPGGNGRKKPRGKRPPYWWETRKSEEVTLPYKAPVVVYDDSGLMADAKVEIEHAFKKKKRMKHLAAIAALLDE